MKLQTTIPISFAPPGISYDDCICMLGSCFTTEIGKKIQDSGFDVHIHSHGIVYNPHAIRQCIQDILENRIYTHSDLIQYNGSWISLQHHGSFSSPNPEAIIEKINQNITLFHDALLKQGVLFITLGTFWVYRYKSTEKIVANCHKIPSYFFEKLLLNLEEETSAWIKLLEQIHDFNPRLRIIFTISPVKHLHDGFFDNNLSKGMLHVLIHRILSRHTFPGYFPSYEIMQDELRDYRFYDQDLMHPNKLAVDIIWEKFSQQYFTYSTKDIYNKTCRLISLWQHRIMDSTSAETQTFIHKRKVETDLFQKEHPDIYARVIKGLEMG